MRLQGLGLRDGARQAWPAGDQGIHERVSGGQQPAPGADQRPSRARWALTEPAAAQVAAHRTRDSKELLSPEEVLRRHRELAAQHGHQADRVVAEARQHGQQHAYESRQSRAGGRDLCPRSSLRAFGGAGANARFWRRRSTGAWVRRTIPGPAGVRAAGPDGRVSRRRSWPGSGPAVHHRGHAAHGARDHRPDAGRQPARLSAIRCW